MLVYDRHNYTASSPFYYWATNRIVNNQVVDCYWNTKQKAGQPDSVDAESLEVAKFKDGYYWVKVIAADISNNADTDFQIPRTKFRSLYPVRYEILSNGANDFQNIKILNINFYLIFGIIDHKEA